jgi:2,4-dienoyl-CoA reductase (NADPH2)
VPWEGGGQIPLDAGGWQTLGPSAVPFAEGQRPPQSLDEAGIRAVIGQFRAAAQRAVKAGFRVIELHAAHGYLLHEFLSPLSNRRTDRYGGSLENRTRIVLEAASALREVVPQELPLFVRISATDWVEGGWDLPQSVQLAKALKPLGVDLIDCSSGALVPGAKIPVGKGYQVPFADAIREQASIMTGAVGMITEPQQANEIVTSGAADLVFLARELLREPYWALHAQKALNQEPSWPTPYGYAVKRRT